MKLCKDCKHFVPNLQDWNSQQYADRYATCGLTSKVTGFDGDMCSTRREWSLFEKCGPDGKQWEPK